jgi:purine-nucleoside phosphorylase
MEPEHVDGAALEAAAFLRSHLGEAPRLAVILGTGWAGLTDRYQAIASVAFEDVAGFTTPGCPGHKGEISVIEAAGKRVLVQSGRLHCYEGFSPLEVSFPIWAYAAMGVEAVLLTAAAGGLNPVYSPGDLMVVADHINLLGPDPLIGIPDKAGRDRFMLEAGYYADGWMDRVEAALPPTLKAERGTYAFNAGPGFETNAEAVMLRLYGADAVGMSVTSEAITAGYLGMGLAALCCISNVLLPARTQGVTPDSIMAVVGRTVSMMDGFLEALASPVDVIG